MSGEVIGVNTAILSETGTFAGLGFAMPSNIAARIYNQLVESGKVTRGSVGISYQDQPGVLRAMGLRADAGVVVGSVTPGGPAAKAGLRAGDVITEIDGKPTPNGEVLLDIVANTPVGKSIQVKVHRDGREQSIPVVIEDRAIIFPEEAAARSNRRPRDEQGETAQTRLGVRVQEITPDMARTLRLDSPSGVLVADVEADSPAEDAGLVQGMIIRQVISGAQRVEIRGLDDFRNAETLMKPGAEIALMVLFQNNDRWQSTFIPLRIQ
jgi:serine protease Do